VDARVIVRHDQRYIHLDEREFVDAQDLVE